MKRRILVASALTTGLLGSVLLGSSGTALAQGGPIGGRGNHYFLEGAGNGTGRAVEDYRFGDPGDEAYVGDLVGPSGTYAPDGQDDLMVRRGNQFFIRGADGTAVRTFRYGDPGDQILVGDWDGDGLDTIAVRRGNFFMEQSAPGSEKAGQGPSFGDPTDQIYIANFRGAVKTTDGRSYATDTLVARRGNHFFVKSPNLFSTAYDFYFGDPGDEVLIGDWAVPPVIDPAPGVPADRNPIEVEGTSGDLHEELAVRRGNVYHVSEDVEINATRPGYPLGTARTMTFGDPGDTTFVARRYFRYDFFDGQTPSPYFSTVLNGDGLAVRRND
jgi:hypothetical protein